MSLKEQTKQAVVAKYQREKTDTGSPEVQIALLTKRIEQLSAHMETHKKDVASRRGLLMMVARRRKLLDYLKKKNEKGYQELIKALGIRR